MLTDDYSDMINDRKLIRDTAEKERPTSDARQLKWQEIEQLKDDREIELLEQGAIEIG